LTQSRFGSQNSSVSRSQGLCARTPPPLAMTVEPIGPCTNQPSEPASVDIDRVATNRSRVSEWLDRDQVVPSRDERIMFAALMRLSGASLSSSCIRAPISSATHRHRSRPECSSASRSVFRLKSCLAGFSGRGNSIGLRVTSSASQAGRRSCSLERDDFSSNRHPALGYWWSMIFSENRYPLFGIMLYSLFASMRFTSGQLWEP
jgi:hypothetical protein